MTPDDIAERIAATEQRMAERAAQIARTEAAYRQALAELGAAQLEDKGALALLYELREMSGEG